MEVPKKCWVVREILMYPDCLCYKLWGGRASVWERLCLTPAENGADWRWQQLQETQKLSTLLGAVPGKPNHISGHRSPCRTQISRNRLIRQQKRNVSWISSHRLLICCIFSLNSSLSLCKMNPRETKTKAWSCQVTLGNLFKLSPNPSSLANHNGCGRFKILHSLLCRK